MALQLFKGKRDRLKQMLAEVKFESEEVNEVSDSLFTK